MAGSGIFQYGDVIHDRAKLFLSKRAGRLSGERRRDGSLESNVAPAELPLLTA
jgi:hypothetical protein